MIAKTAYVAALAAAAALAMFAAGYAAYMALIPLIGSAFSAGVVAAAAALIVAGGAIRLAYRAKHANPPPAPEPSMADHLGQVLREHPRFALSFSVLVAIIAGRQPGVFRNVLLALAPAIKGRLL